MVELAPHFTSVSTMPQENEEASRRRDLHTGHDAVAHPALCSHHGLGLRFTGAHLTGATAEPGPGIHARDRAGEPSLAARANRLALRKAAIVRAVWTPGILGPTTLIKKAGMGRGGALSYPS